MSASARNTPPTDRASESHAEGAGMECSTPAALPEERTPLVFVFVAAAWLLVLGGLLYRIVTGNV